jgi:6-pyruvoyltetrahydropterin/6-carboxytetrahydropterin synthase
MFELTKEFRFEAAHTLERKVDTESSRRIHGHSYRAEITLRGPIDVATGMIVDLGVVEKALMEARDALDHHMLDDVKDLGPATMENLSAWVWKRLSSSLPQLYKVAIHRDSCFESCVYYGPKDKAA